MPDRRKDIFAAGICGLFLFAFAITAWHAQAHKSATYDEPLHWVSGWMQATQSDFRVDPEDPAFWKYYAVLGSGNVHLNLKDPGPHAKIMDAFYWTPGVDAGTLLHAAHFRMLLLGMLLGCAIGIVAWNLAGRIAAVIAVATYSLDPNFLAHSVIVKNDVPFALLFLLLFWAVWLAGRKLTIPRAIWVALFLAMAVTTKFSGILAFLIVAIVFLCRAAIDQPWPVFNGIAQTRPRRFFVAAVLLLFAASFSYGFVWDVYDFRFSNNPQSPTVDDMSDLVQLYSFSQTIRQHDAPRDADPDQVRQWVESWHPDHKLRLILWADRNHLLPHAYLRGFLYTFSSTIFRGTYLNGELSLMGWWYYFPLAILYKTPLATLIAAGISILAGTALLPRAISKNSWTLCALALPPLIYLVVSMESRFNLGLRHIFPIYPFLFILIGVIAARFVAHRRALAACLILIFVIGIAAETFSAYPDFLPFFNIAFGGERGGAHLLSDSNLDWGQDLPALADWQKQHPDVQLCLCYFGGADPRYYGIRYVNVFNSSAPIGQPFDPSLPTVYAISVTRLQGTYDTTSEHAPLLQFENRQPIAILGGSIYLFNP
jgi:AraC-like DNA-binding protein